MARIDDSHQPFKRTKKIGPGPKRRPAITQHKDWECVKVKPKKKGTYAQLCTYIGNNAKRRGKKRRVVTKVKTKKRYNKIYRAWLKRKGGKTKGKLPGYRCRKTPSTKCK